MSGVWSPARQERESRGGRAVSSRRRGTRTPRTGFRLLFPPGGWGCRGHSLNRRVERVVLDAMSGRATLGHSLLCRVWSWAPGAGR